MRICSFLPSATEILCALGLEEQIAGVTFECDHPPQVRGKPVVVYTRLKISAEPAEIDRQVNEAVERGESLYRIDVEKLKEIQPDLIITQDLCHVCAASSDDLAGALNVLPRSTQVLSLSPHRLEDIWNDIIVVGEATGRRVQALSVVENLKQRVGKVRQAVEAIKQRPCVLCLEWLDPPFVAGHWVPEMVAIAGGVDVMGQAGKPGFRTTWDEIFEAAPDIVVAMPCGYDLKRTSQEVTRLSFPEMWNRLPAIVHGRCFAVDGSGYFSRPGPRVSTGLEILARAIHSECAREFSDPPAGAMAKVRKYARAA
ncbi:MAG TPA: cobalamin-binding protein [Terriglobales bacterium]|nr:cobalamin-binding protein [Terriglobales bacterium]